MALAAAPGIGPGDHACCVYGSDEQQAGLVTRFVRDALARGDRVLYLGDRSDQHGLISLLDHAGLDGRAVMHAGSLSYMHSSQMGLDDGFDRERQMAVWDALIRQARSDGHRGLAVAAEMTWAQTWKVESEALIDYEMCVGPAFESGEFAAICQYDSRAFSGDVLRKALHAHPVSVQVHHHGWTADYLRMHVDHATETGAFAVAGEIDIANIDYLALELEEQLSDGDAVADCSGLTFVDIAGCRLLRQACNGAIGKGRLSLENAPPLVTRVMALCELAD